MFFTLQSMNPIWCTLLLCIALLCAVSHGTLDNGEKDALAQLLTSFPNLGSIATSEIIQDANIDYGRSWTNNFDNLCLNGDGYEYYGLFCSEGHISGIVLTKAWDPQIFQNFSSITGLTYLKNVTVTLAPVSRDIDNFALVLAKMLRIEHMDLRKGYPSLMKGDFGYPSYLRSLRASFYLNFDLTPFSGLQSLDVTSSRSTNLGIWPPSLQSLRVNGPVLAMSELFQLVSNSTNLKSFTAINPQSNISGPNLTLVSESLETLDLTIGASENYTLTINSSSLKVAAFSIHETPLVLHTPNLQKLTISRLHRIPLGFTELSHLEELRLPKLNISGSDFPDLGFAVNLASLSLEEWSVEPSELSAVLCNIATNNLRLSSLKLAFLKAPIPGTIFYLPACLRTAGQLKSLYLSTYAYITEVYPLHAASFKAALPSSLEYLLANVVLDSDTNIYDFAEFRQLKDLTLVGSRFVGEMKNDFFFAFPNLEKLYIASTKVYGTIPSIGWAKMRHLSLAFTNVTKWTRLDSAPYLTYVHIRSNFLESIPNDIYLVNLAELEHFEVLMSEQVSIPTPSFWTRLPKLRQFSVYTGNFHGPIRTSIAAPRLNWLDLETTGVCGPLPDFDIPMTLDRLDLYGNRFSGTIPQSWVANLTIRSSIYLANNQLSGTVPSDFISKKKLSLTALKLSNNNFNICDSLPVPNMGLKPSCTFLNVSVCPEDGSECLTSWQDSCDSLQCTTQSMARIVPPIEECIVRVDQCPPPGPPGFSCIDGQWVSNGSLTIPSIALPPNGGVIVVHGNLSSNGSLTFDGIGTSIVVEGCVENLPTEVQIVITKDGGNLKTTDLISQQGLDCPHDLSLIPVNLVQDKNDCKQVKTSTKGSSRSSLIVVFEIDSHKCNTKWIILGSVLGGVVIIVLAGVTVVYHLSPRFRMLIRSCRLKND